MIFDVVTNKLFKALLDGTAKVGDAKKLGGKGASEYVLGTAFKQLNLGQIRIAETVLDTLAQDYGVANTQTYIATINASAGLDGAGDYLMGGMTYTLIGMQYGNYAYGYQMAIAGMPTNPCIKFRRVYAGVWGNWKTLLTTDGGEINGNFTAKPASGASSHAIILKNALREIAALSYTSDGFFALRDNTNSKNIITSSADGTNTFNGMASENLLLTGGTVGTGGLRKPLNVMGTDDCMLGFLNKNGTLLGTIGVHSSGKPIFDSYELHHDGNSAKVVFTPDSTTAPAADALWAHL